MYHSIDFATTQNILKGRMTLGRGGHKGAFWGFKSPKYQNIF